MLRILLLLILLLDFSFALGEQNSSAQIDAENKKLQIENLQKRIADIDKRLSGDNIWIKKYSNYDTYKRIVDDIDEIHAAIAKLEKQRRSKAVQEELDDYNRQLELLEGQKELLGKYKESPFKDLIQPEDVTDIPTVENPIAIINAFSFIKQLQQKKEGYERHSKQLKEVIDDVKNKREFLERLIVLEGDEHYKKELKSLVDMQQELDYALKIFSTTLNVYNKKIDEIIISLTEQIKQQFKKSAYIGLIILIFFVISFFIKLATRKYINDNERLYTVNKIVNFITFLIVVIILLFSYLENVSYLVTVLGFASAGLAIAMKDLFMSILGWMVIVLGGSIHVGDRVKVMKDGVQYVGDVLDVSLLRITIHEDVTLTSYMHNRRAGRIIFIPNNYVFTTLISNYSHSHMKTVWDGIDITVTFDSDFRKASNIARDIVKKYSKGYTDITRKHLNMLRDKYSLRNTNVDPRIYTFIEPNGIRISVWYLTNSFATLTLRSTISGDIVSEFAKHDSIQIAYPTTTIKSEREPIASGEIPEISFEAKG